MNYNLTAEQDMIIRSLRAFREQELEPFEAEVDRSGEVPPELGERIKQRALHCRRRADSCNGWFAVMDAMPTWMAVYSLSRLRLRYGFLPAVSRPLVRNAG